MVSRAGNTLAITRLLASICTIPCVSLLGMVNISTGYTTLLFLPLKFVTRTVPNILRSMVEQVMNLIACYGRYGRYGRNGNVRNVINQPAFQQGLAEPAGRTRIAGRQLDIGGIPEHGVASLVADFPETFQVAAAVCFRLIQKMNEASEFGVDMQSWSSHRCHSGWEPSR